MCDVNYKALVAILGFWLLAYVLVVATKAYANDDYLNCMVNEVKKRQLACKWQDCNYPKNLDIILADKRCKRFLNDYNYSN